MNQNSASLHANSLWCAVSQIVFLLKLNPHTGVQIPVRVTNKKSTSHREVLFFLLTQWNQNPVCFRLRKYTKRAVRCISFSLSLHPHVGVQIPVRVTNRNKSELFRHKRCVRICFLFQLSILKNECAGIAPAHSFYFVLLYILRNIEHHIRVNRLLCTHPLNHAAA